MRRDEWVRVKSEEKKTFGVGKGWARIMETGNTYGYLTVTGPAPSKVTANGTAARWACRCRCGKEVIVAGDCLRRGESKSCGECWVAARRERNPMETWDNPDGVSFSFVIESKKNGRHVFIAPMSVRAQVTSRSWAIQPGKSRASGREFSATWNGIPIHRLIWGWLGRPEVPQIDHVDGDPKNNREDNLRDGSGSVNAINCRDLRRDNTTGYRGVARDGARWRAYVVSHRKMRYARGSFSTKEEAARARDKLAIQYHGHIAVLNFPSDDTTAPVKVLVGAEERR